MTKKKETPTFDHLQEAMDEAGFGDINAQTMSIPFLRLLQDLSPQQKKGKTTYVEGAESGMLINTVSERLYDWPLKAVIGKFERYYVEWGEGRGKFIAAHLPETIEVDRTDLVRNEKNKLIDPKTGNSFVDTYMYYVILPDHMEDGVCIIAMSSSLIKEAKRLNRMLTHTTIPGSDKRALPYFMVWDLDKSEESNDEGDWWGLKFTFDSFVSQPQLEHVVEERKSLPDKKVDFTQLTNTAGKETEEGDVKY